MMKNKNWTIEEINILKENYGKIKSKEIINLLPKRSVNGIILKASQIGLKGNPSLTRRKVEVDLNFFSEPNLINSYWGGFIAADGNIKKNKNLVRIKLAEKDKHHLENFAKCCKLIDTIKEAKKNKGSFAPNKKAFELGVHSKQWVQDLYKNYSITPAKSLTLMPPSNLDLNNKLCFICGVIDGDGCIYKSKGWRDKIMVCCKVVGTKSILEYIKETIDVMCPPNIKSHTISNIIGIGCPPKGPISTIYQII
jgi:hypothetical protein